MAPWKSLYVVLFAKELINGAISRSIQLEPQQPNLAAAAAGGGGDGSELVVSDPPDPQG